MIKSDTAEAGDGEKQGAGFYLVMGYIITMYLAYYYSWGQVFLNYLRERLSL